MIQVHVFRKGKEVREVPVAELSQVRAEPQTLVWVDLVSATAEELAAMARSSRSTSSPWPAAPSAASSGPGSRSSRARCC